MIADCMSKYIGMSVEELGEVVKNSKLPVLDMLIARVLATGIQKADQSRFNFILERMIGKVKDEVDVTSNGNDLSALPQVHVYLPANGRTKEENKK